MQSNTFDVAFRILWLHGYLLFHPLDQNSCALVLQVLLSLCSRQLDLVLPYAFRSFHLGQHNLLGKHQSTRVLTSKHRLRVCIRSQNTLDHCRSHSCCKLDRNILLFIGCPIFWDALHFLEHYFESCC